jgi:tetratricopeptide (TPR) repeat protein
MRSNKEGPKLSGIAEFELNLSSDTETVLSEEKSGEEKVHWEEDKLTGQRYQVTTNGTREVASNYDFQRASGTLTVKWWLIDPKNGNILDDGILTYSGERSHGNYINNRDRVKRTWNIDNVRNDIITELVKQAADALIEMSGPLFTSNDLDTAMDDLSQRAKSMVYKGDWEGASILWSELLKQNPNFVPALYNLGLYKEKEGDLVSAWEYYRQAFLVDQSPKYRQALTRLTAVLRHQNQLPKAGNLNF